MYKIRHWKWSSLYYIVNVQTCRIMKYSADKKQIEEIFNKEYNVTQTGK